MLQKIHIFSGGWDQNQGCFSQNLFVQICINNLDKRNAADQTIFKLANNVQRSGAKKKLKESEIIQSLIAPFDLFY